MRSPKEMITKHLEYVLYNKLPSALVINFTPSDHLDRIQAKWISSLEARFTSNHVLKDENLCALMLPTCESALLSLIADGSPLP